MYVYLGMFTDMISIQFKIFYWDSINIIQSTKGSDYSFYTI